MQQSSPPSRKPSALSDPLQQRLNAYALAASAAGVGLLALAQPADAKILYAKTHVIIGYGGMPSFDLRLTRHGTANFQVREGYTCSTGCQAGLSVYPLSSNNQVEGSEHGYDYHAYALRPGARIGRGEPFIRWRKYAADSMVGASTSQVWGDWNNVKNRYLGLKFKFRGKVHFGWARLNV